MGSDLTGGGPGDERAGAAGQGVLELFTAFVSGLTRDTADEVKRHAFTGGLKVGQDDVPPGELGAFSRTLFEKYAYFTCATDAPQPGGARER